MLRLGVFVSYTPAGHACIRCVPSTSYLLFAIFRTRFTTRPACGHPVSVDCFWFAARSWNQKPNGEGGVRHQHCLVDWSKMVGGELLFYICLVYNTDDRMQEWVPRRQPDDFGLNERAFSRSRERSRGGRRDYVGIPESHSPQQ